MCGLLGDIDFSAAARYNFHKAFERIPWRRERPAAAGPLIYKTIYMHRQMGLQAQKSEGARIGSKASLQS